jgi:RNA polymerase sigma-70 factor (ECF subfamily)
MPSNEDTKVPAPPETAEDKAAIRERDAELVRRAQAGELEAFDELVTHYRAAVYSMIVNMIRNDADAWDLAQDVFVKAWRALSGFESRAGFYTWLYRITHNTTYDWLRKKKVRGDVEFDDGVALDAEAGSVTAPRESATPDTRLEHRELGDRIEQAIAALSDDHRQVILLKEVEGLSYQEMADVIGCSIGTIMSRLFYARKSLQHMLKDLHPCP